MKRIAAVVFAFTSCCFAQAPRQIARLAADVPIKSVTVCNQGSEIVGIDAQHKVRIWSLPSSTQRFVATDGDGTSSVVCSPDGKTLALVSRDGRLTIVDASKNQSKAPVAVSWHMPNFVDVSNGGLVAAALSERPPRLLRGAEKPVDLHTDFGGTNGIAISADASLVATADTDTMVRIYDSTGKLKSAVNAGEVEPFFVAFSKDAKEVYVSGADGVIRTIDVAAGKVVRTSEKFGTASLAMMMSGGGDEALVLMMDEYTMEPDSAAIWNAKTNQVRKVQLPPKEFIGAGAGKTGWILVKQEEKALTLWELH